MKKLLLLFLITGCAYPDREPAEGSMASQSLSQAEESISPDPGYTDTEYEIYDYVIETTSISTEQAKLNMAEKHGISVDEVTAITDKVMTAIFFPESNGNNPEESIRNEISDFANVRNTIIRRDYALIEYEHTFTALNQNDVHRQTKQHMQQVLDAVIEFTDSERIRLAPYHPGESSGFVAVALLTIERSDYVNGKDVESYPEFDWKN